MKEARHNCIGDRVKAMTVLSGPPQASKSSRKETYLPTPSSAAVLATGVILKHYFL